MRNKDTVKAMENMCHFYSPCFWTPVTECFLRKFFLYSTVSTALKPFITLFEQELIK